MFSVKLYNAVFKGKRNFLTVITAAACLVAIMQLAAIIYINIFQLKSHIDADASITFLNDLEKYSPLYAGGTVIRTSDSGVGLINFLTKIKLSIFGGNVFLYYGLKNILTAFTAVALSFQFFRKLKTTPLAGMLSLIILLCPFISLNLQVVNDLGYYACMFISAGYYGKRILLEMLIIYNVIDLTQTGKPNIPLVALSAIYVVNSGMNDGMYLLLNVLFPMIAYIVSSAMIKKDIKQIISKQGAYILLCIILLFAGKLYANKIAGAEAIDEGITFVMLTNLWTNICSIVYGYMSIFDCMPYQQPVPVTSLVGAQYMLNMVIFAVSVIAFVYFIYKLCKKDEGALNRLPFFCVTVSVFVIHCLINPTFSNEGELRGERYLIPIFISGLFITGYFIDSLKDEKLFKKAGALVLTGVVALTSLYSYKLYNDRRINIAALNNIIEEVKKYDTPVVYGWGKSFNFVTCNTSQATNVLRALDHTRVYKALFDSYNNVSTFGDYRYFNDKSFYEGKTMLLSTAEEFAALPTYISGKYTLVYEEPSTNECLYISDSNPFDLTSSVSNGKNIELPYSTGITMQLGAFDADGSYVSNGAGGMVLYGSAKSSGDKMTEAGTYNVTLNYEIESCEKNSEAIFTVMSGADLKENVIDIPIDINAESVTIENVGLPTDDYPLGYMVNVTDGVIIRIKSIEINAVE